MAEIYELVLETEILFTLDTASLKASPSDAVSASTPRSINFLGITGCAAPSKSLAQDRSIYLSCFLCPTAREFPLN
jgi:hypothetical protein